MPETFYWEDHNYVRETSDAPDEFGYSPKVTYRHKVDPEFNLLPPPRTQVPSRPEWCADGDTYVRGEVLVPAMRPAVPLHMRSHGQSQIIGVNPRTEIFDPVDVHKEGDMNNVRRPNKVVYVEVPGVQREPEHVPGTFQTIFDVNHPQDASTHLELLITDDLEAELEMFSQLQRLGNFGAARNYFEKNLEPHLNNPYVFIQYGQMLLDQGDYLAFERLDPGVVFGKDARPNPWAPQTVEGWHRNLGCSGIRYQSRGLAVGATRCYSDDASRDDQVRSIRPPPLISYIRPRDEETIYQRPTRSQSRDLESVERDSDSNLDDESYYFNHSPDRKLMMRDTEAHSEQDELEILRQNWRLLQATSSIHRRRAYKDACSEAWYTIEYFQFGANLDSTELQIVVLVLQLCAEIGYVLSEWYHTDGLQEAAARWVDWRALFKKLLMEGRIWEFKDLHVALVAAFPDSADEMLFGTGDIKCSLIYDWLLDEDDESTNLALLSLFVEPAWVRPWYKDEAQSRAETIISSSPTAMKSRPFIRWIMWDAADALISMSEAQGREPPLVAEASRLQEFPGMTWISHDFNNTSAYVPRSNENPGWPAPIICPEVEERFQLALNLAKELRDYKSQANCYKRLIRHSKDPTELIEELAYLQNEIQGDKRGHLETLLPRYLLCKTRSAQEKLLKELERTSDEGDATTLWARDFVERAVKRTLEGPRSAATLRKPASFYMNMGLPREVEHFILQNTNYDPPGSQQEPPGLSQTHRGPILLPRRPAAFQGQEKIRPLSKYRPYGPPRGNISHPESQQQLPAYVRSNEPDQIKALQTKALERYRSDYQEDREADGERGARQMEKAGVVPKRVRNHRAQETKDSQDQEFPGLLQLSQQDMRRFKARQHQNRLVGRKSLAGADSRDASSAGDDHDASSDASSHASRKWRSENRKMTSSADEKQTKQQSDRIKESSDEDRPSKSSRDRAGHRHGTVINSPQPSPRNSLVVFGRSPGSPDPYISGDALRIPVSTFSQPMDHQLNFEGYAIITTRPDGRPTLEKTTVHFQDRVEASNAEPKRDRAQSVSESEENSGELGELGPPSPREARSRGLEEPEADIVQYGDRSVSKTPGAGYLDHDEPKGSVQRPNTYSDGNKGEAGDRDHPNVHQSGKCDQYLSNSPQEPVSRSAAHQDSDDHHASGRRSSTSRRRRTPPRCVGLDKDHEICPPEEILDQPGTNFRTSSGETGEDNLCKPRSVGLQDNDEPRPNNQNKSIANRPPKDFAGSPGLERAADEWYKITTKERKKLNRDKRNDTKDELAHRDVVTDPSPGIMRAVTARSRTCPPSASEHYDIQGRERCKSWRDNRAVTPHRKQPEPSSRRSSLVFDADGRPQPSQRIVDHRLSWVSEANSDSHKRRNSVDKSHMFPDTGYRTSIERPRRPLISRSQSTGETGSRLRRMGLDSSVSETSFTENWKKEKDRLSKRKEPMSALPEDPDEVAQSVAPQQQPQSKAEQSSKLQVSRDPEPGISRKSTVADPEPGEE